MNADFCLLCFAAIFVPAVIFSGFRIVEAVRSRSTHRTFQRLSLQDRDQVLDRIDAAGRVNPACTLFVAGPADAATAVDPAGSHYGGVPYAQASDAWPSAPDNSAPASFLIQVRLDDTLPPPWPGRLVVVFGRLAEVTVRSYAGATADSAVPLGCTVPPQPQWNLRPVRIPRQRDGKGLLDYDPVVLLSTVPELTEQLGPHARRAAEVLGLILAPNHSRAWGFELSDIVQVGGHPVWMFDDPGDRHCAECGRVMRFLLQFGDLNGGDLLGDSGVCYVFGCDDHPEQLQGITQLG